MKKALYILALVLIISKYIVFNADGFWIVYLSMFGFVVLIALLGLSLIYFISIILNKSFNISIVMPLLISALSLVIIIYNPIGKAIEYFKSPIVLGGYCEHTVTYVSLSFREDGTFYHNPGNFLSNKSAEGEYRIKDDTIFLQFTKGMEDINTNDTLIIRSTYFEELSTDSLHHHVFKIETNHLND
ncbi:MAG: hypothetical protein KAG64_07225 [Bacteroidales bacterium]|nr:hypothetical protein [Bacteroidales bacterium]